MEEPFHSIKDMKGTNELMGEQVLEIVILFAGGDASAKIEQG